MLTKLSKPDLLFRIAVILVAIYFIFPPFQNWKTIALLRRMDLDFDFIREISRPDSGLTVLPEEVQRALKGLKEKNVSEFRMVGDFKKKGYLYQRLTESAWPVRSSDTAEIIVGFRKDLTGFSDCTTIYQDKDIAIVRLRK